MQNHKEIKFYWEKYSPQDIIQNYLLKNNYSLEKPLIKNCIDAKTKISIVIPAYNEAIIIEKLLKALERQTLKNFEVVTAENNSEDNTYEVIKNFQKKVNYPLHIVLEPNPGVSYARKTGMDLVLMRLLKTKSFNHIIAVTDADTIPPKNWTKKIFEEFKDDRIGGLAGTHIASEKVEKQIERKVGIKNYFNFLSTLIEFLEKNNIGEIKMSGPNSAFNSLAYAVGDGIKSEYDKIGRLKLNEVNNLGKRIKNAGYILNPMKCSLIKNRRRELFEIINNGKDSYFPKGYSSQKRFNIIRENETELLNIACQKVPKEEWIKYRHKMIYKVIKNFILLPIKTGKISINDVGKVFSSDEIEFLLKINNQVEFNQKSSIMLGKILTSLENKLS